MMEQYNEELEKNPKSRKVIYIFIGLFILTITAVSVFFLIQKSPVCGNEKCEKSENCDSCFEDCKCSEGLYCSEGKCIEPTCGNNKCEYFEDDCCIDCGCTESGYVCNMNTNECEFKEFTISNDRVTELVTDYFTNQGKEIISMNITNLVTWENKVGKYVNVYVKDQSWVSSVIVTEDEEVVDTTL